jgi:hypothetical protein
MIGFYDLYSIGEGLFVFALAEGLRYGQPKNEGAEANE